MSGRRESALLERAAEATATGSAEVVAGPEQVPLRTAILRLPRPPCGDNDEAIAREVKLAVDDLLHLADCGLRVEQGVVYLVGRVQRRSQIDELARRLAGLSGVHQVRNMIQFEVDDRRPARSAGWP
jgi:osmotically-inducible protein OsmY